MASVATTLLQIRSVCHLMKNRDIEEMEIGDEIQT